MADTRIVNNALYPSYKPHHSALHRLSLLHTSIWAFGLPFHTLTFMKAPLCTTILSVLLHLQLVSGRRLYKCRSLSCNVG